MGSHLRAIKLNLFSPEHQEKLQVDQGFDVEIKTIKESEENMSELLKLWLGESLLTTQNPKARKEKMMS